MHVITRTIPTIWLRTDRQVVPTNTVTWKHLAGVEGALHQGLFAIADPKRPEFYEIEIGDHWYYIHIPGRFTGVYLIAAGPKLSAESIADYESPSLNRR